MPDELNLLRTSERACFTRCRMRWWWAYHEGLTPKLAAPALRFGSLVHGALEKWYKPGNKRGRKPWLTFRDLYNKELEQLEEFGMYTEEGDWEDARTLGDAMLRHYVQHYGTDAHLEVIAPEQDFQIDLEDPDTGLYVCTYVGTFDAVIRNKRTGRIGLFEHKTAKAISTAHLSLDEQAGAYWAFAPDWLRAQGILGKKEDLDFILYNFLRKAKPDQRPMNQDGLHLNKDGSISKSQPPPYFKRQEVLRGQHDRREVMLRAIQQAKEIEMVRNEELAHYKNPTKDCSWDCDFGPKTGLCEMHEIGDDWEEIRDSLFTYWNPYEAHDLVYEKED